MSQLITTQDSTNASDTYFDSTNATTNYNTEQLTYIGESGGQITRGILRFPEISSIPSNATINSASLEIWIGVQFAANSTVEFHQVRTGRDWVVSQATWTIYKTSNNWGTAGGGNTTTDILSASDDLSVTTGDAAGTKKTLTLSASVIQAWVSGSANNQGWLIKTTAESGDQGAFKSGNNATSGHIPKLTVNYTAAGGSPVIFSTGGLATA